MNKKDSKPTIEAQNILSHIEGTLIADLKSLKTLAVKLKKDPNLVENGGSLNYLIFLVGLVGCETLGNYAYGADLHKSSKENTIPDIGGYINRFIENYFPQGDPFKKISKIMSDYLRHILIHGYAPRKDGYPFQLSLVVSNGNNDYPPLAFESNKILGIQIDAISFLDRILKAFTKLKKDSESSIELIKKIIEAEKYCKTIAPSKKILNEFIANYPKLNKISNKSSLADTKKRHG